MNQPHVLEFAVICPLLPLTECIIFLLKHQQCSAISSNKLVSYASPLVITTEQIHIK